MFLNEKKATQEDLSYEEEEEDEDEYEYEDEDEDENISPKNQQDHQGTQNEFISIPRSRTPDGLRNRIQEQQRHYLQDQQKEYFTHTIAENKYFKMKKSDDHLDFSKFAFIDPEPQHLTVRDSFSLQGIQLIETQSFLVVAERKESQLDVNVPELTDFTTLNVAALNSDDKKATEESEYEYEEDATEEVVQNSIQADADQEQQGLSPIHFDKVNTTEQPQKDEIPDIVNFGEQSQVFNDYPKPLIISIVNIKQFLLEPVLQGGMIQCTIRRENSGLKTFSPKYDLYLTQNMKYLMSAKKKAGSSEFILSYNEKEIQRRSPFFLGTIEITNDEKHFTFYDDGHVPKKKSYVINPRKVLGAMLFDHLNQSTKQPSHKTVLIPDAQFDKDRDIIKEYLANNRSDKIIYDSKQPSWDTKLQSFVLNFHGRAEVASIKNFQLVRLEEPPNRRSIYFQIGKINEKLFNLDFQHPLTPLQAFMIGLTSFEFKLKL